MMMQQQKKIALIVEDDRLNAELFARTLERRNFHCIISIDVLNAIEMLNEITPDLIMVDIHLPQFSGLEVIRLVRETPRLSKVRVIVATASHMMSDAPEVEMADIFLAKPVYPSELLVFADRLLGELNQGNVVS